MPEWTIKPDQDGDLDLTFEVDADMTIEVMAYREESNPGEETLYSFDVRIYLSGYCVSTFSSWDVEYDESLKAIEQVKTAAIYEYAYYLRNKMNEFFKATESMNLDSYEWYFGS